jgi:hypothetical protein
MKPIKLANKRERWGLTGWGWLAVLLLLTVWIWVTARNIVPFLSKEETIAARVMVLEGYVPDYAFPEIIRIFTEDNYEFLIATGTSYDQGFYISGVRSSAELIGKSLKNIGFDTTKMAVVPASSDVYRDRTFYTGQAVKTYLQKYRPEVKSINLVSVGVHARRSHYLYKLAIGSELKVGNIVIPDKNFNKKNWYKSSLGFRTVLNETIGYLYIHWIFAPERQK